MQDSGDICEEIGALINSLEISDLRKKNRVANLIEDLRSKKFITDFRFDQIYSEPIRNLSNTNWTPVLVAARVVELLDVKSETRVLDVGSGSGKFCIVGALRSRGTFTGIERRPYLVEIARVASKELGVENVSYIAGDMADLDWYPYDCVYLFNPFYENRVEAIRIDNLFPADNDQYNRYCDVTHDKLKAMRSGTRVATYHGFGGQMPYAYDLVLKDSCGTGCIEIWKKREILASKVRRHC